MVISVESRTFSPPPPRWGVPLGTW